MSFEEIINQVQSRPELWQSTNPYYKKRVVQKKIWREIASDIGLEETMLRKRWKHLKDQYRKELKKILSQDSNMPNDLHEDCRSGWQYFPFLGFLKDEILHRDRQKQHPPSDSESREMSDDSDVPANATIETPKVKKIKKNEDELTKPTKANLILKHLRNINKTMQSTGQDEAYKSDPDCMFLMSLLPSMKKLTDIQKLQFRGKVNDWLLEALSLNEYSSHCDNKIFVHAQIVNTRGED